MTGGWMGRCIGYGALFALLAVMFYSFCPACAAEPERPEWVRFGACTAPGDAACAGWPEDEEQYFGPSPGM